MDLHLMPGASLRGGGPRPVQPSAPAARARAVATPPRGARFPPRTVLRRRHRHRVPAPPELGAQL